MEIFYSSRSKTKDKLHFRKISTLKKYFSEIKVIEYRLIS